MFEQMAAMGETIQHRGCHWRIVEDLGPAGKLQVGGNDQAPAVVIPIGNELKKHLSTFSRQRYEPQFIKNNAAVTLPLTQDACQGMVISRCE